MHKRIAIVTGAGASGAGWGIGQAIATLFGRSRMGVLLVDQNATHVNRTLEAIAAEGGTAQAYIGDVTMAEDVARMTEQCLATFGRIDILCNNVGGAGRPGLLESSEAEWDRLFALNVKSAFLA